LDQDKLKALYAARRAAVADMEPLLGKKDAKDFWAKEAEINDLDQQIARAERYLSHVSRNK
jgi:hypothetical protein